jgi:hypothetical protein
MPRATSEKISRHRLADIDMVDNGTKEGHSDTAAVVRDLRLNS